MAWLGILATIFSNHIIPRRRDSNPRQSVVLHQTGTFVGRSSNWATAPLQVWNLIMKYLADLFRPGGHTMAASERKRSQRGHRSQELAAALRQPWRQWMETVRWRNEGAGWSFWCSAALPLRDDHKTGKVQSEEEQILLKKTIYWKNNIHLFDWNVAVITVHYSSAIPFLNQQSKAF